MSSRKRIDILIRNYKSVLSNKISVYTMETDTKTWEFVQPTVILVCLLKIVGCISAAEKEL
jgi:hypothetical protein